MIFFLEIRWSKTCIFQNFLVLCAILSKNTLVPDNFMAVLMNSYIWGLWGMLYGNM